MRETGGKVSGGKATGAQVSQETGGKGGRLMSEREPDNSLPPSDKTAGQNVMEGIHRKSYSEAVIEGVRKRARVFVWDSIVRKTDRVLNKGDDELVDNVKMHEPLGNSDHNQIHFYINATSESKNKKE